jgi:N-acetylmuramic acid 6-phosphate etherase
MKTPSSHLPLIAGIEGGATRSTILAVRGAQTVAEFELGPCNVLLPEDEMQVHFQRIADRLPGMPAALGIGLAAVRDQTHADKIRRVAAEVWPGVPVAAVSDLETALAAAEAPPGLPRVLVLSGTGSCCYGRTPDGRTAKVGGRGTVMGDGASAVDTGREALRTVARVKDLTQRTGTLARLMLERLSMNEIDDLIPWSLDANKTQLASLAELVFKAAALRDRDARALLDRMAEHLAGNGRACARLLTGGRGPVHFVLNGGMLIKNPGWARKVVQHLLHGRKQWSAAPLRRPSVWGAVELARPLAGTAAVVRKTPASRRSELVPAWIHDMKALAASPTEQRNPRSENFSSLSTADACELMIAEDARLPGALRAIVPELSRLIDETARRLKRGGRLFYAGAGTSGRLGVLDAAEIPPTFRAAPEMVQGIIAGGPAALTAAVEGAEDNAPAGAAAARARRIGRRDVLLGIAASGRTPFVWGALTQAARQGAFTALLCFNPAVREHAAGKSVPRIILAPDTGPEVLTGSTRLKSGTASKLVLNMLTTIVMTRLGKVAGNLMIDLNPSNVKLRDRAVRIVQSLTGLTAAAARELLEHCAWSVSAALQQHARAAKKSRI